MRNRKLVTAAAAGAVLLALSACSGGGGGSSGGGSGPIKIGASVPLTGSLAGFGPIIKAAYQANVDRVNAAGGISIGGTKRKVQLIVQDGKSDPNTVGQQSRDLVLKNNVVALLGSVSPPLAIPAANVAEQQMIPFVGTLTPVEAWKGGNPSGWKYSWDFFFDENQMTDLQFKGANGVATNKKVALFTDNEQDGIVMGKLWTAKAPSLGYSIAYHASFPVGTTDYSSFVDKAKASGAQILIAQMIPPDSFALWKQMKSQGWAPKLVHCEKCGAPGAFQKALGPLAEGTQTTSWVQPSSDPLQAQLIKKYQPMYGQTVDLSTFLAEYSAAKVLTDAIAKAGTTDGAKLSAQIGKTNALEPFGQTVKFGAGNAAPILANSVQWQGPSTVEVYPTGGSAKALQVPAKGLAG